MAHKQQISFCKKVRRLFPGHFYNQIVIDIGSLDINGNNRRFFRKCLYKGIDIVKGDNVDYVGPAHQKLPEAVKDIQHDIYHKYRQFDFSFEMPVSTIVSTECLEHDKFWKLTLKTMYDNLRPGGLLLITCAGEGRAEHGTTDHHAWCSPGTNDYYMNLSNEMFASVLRPSMFDVYHLGQDKGNNDLQFYGIKKHSAQINGKTSKLNIMKKIALLLTTIAALTILSFRDPGTITTQRVHSDTVKPKEQQQEPQFFILGTNNDFKLLEKVIADPANVTPNQVKAVLQWIQNKNQIVTDTTKKKAP